LFRDERLVADVVDACRTAAEATQQPNPERLEQLANQVAKITRAIQANRRNPGDTDEDQRETDQIVAEMRAERAQLQAEIARLQSAHRRRTDVPDEAEVRTLVKEIGTTLTVAAKGDPMPDPRGIRELVQALTGGRILLYQRGERLPKRGWLQGQLRVRLLSYLVERVTGEPGVLADGGVEVTIDYRPPSPLDARADEAWQLRDQGLLNVEIGEQLGCVRSMVTKLLRHAAKMRGVPFEDGRRCRRKNRTPPMYVRVAPDVGRLVDEGLLLAEIAERLGLDRNTVTKAYNRYRADQGLPPLDGRARRKSLDHKNRPPREDDR